MLDNDNLTYKKRVVGSAVTKQAERTLITLERSQKLDLLIHLLANLRQALVVCGPEGIGKTTLLKTLQDLRKDQWQICLLQGSSALSFEAIINHLSRFLNLSNSSVGFDLSSLRAYCEKQKVVLIIDDAGELVPGLIGELVDFADSLSGLRLVFSMTYDEFHIKSASDKAVDDCHFIELPPLNQKQCAEYLQNLSAQPGAMLSFNAVTESLVADLYRQTNGIPGRILAEIPKLNQYQSRRQNRLGLWGGIVLVLLATGWAVTALLPFEPSIDNTTAQPPEPAQPAIIAPTVTPPSASNDTMTPIPTSPAPAAIGNQALPPQVPTEASIPVIASTPAPEPLAPPSPSLDKTPENKPATAPQPPDAAASLTQANEPPSAPLAPEPAPKSPVASAPPVATQASEVAQKEPPSTIEKTAAEQKPKKTASGDSNIDWIMAQPANNYTLQVMTLSTKEAAQRFMKKYADYGDSLTYYTIKSNGLEKFIVIYGSFESATEARQYKEVMPGEFKQALEKRFRAIQNESRR